MIWSQCCQMSFVQTSLVAESVNRSIVVVTVVVVVLCVVPSLFDVNFYVIIINIKKQQFFHNINSDGSETAKIIPVHQWRTDACCRMTSPDPKIKVFQIWAKSVHWPPLKHAKFSGDPTRSVWDICNRKFVLTKKWAKIHQNCLRHATH